MSGAERAALLPSLLTVCALAVLLGLGAWQLDRHAEKQGLIAALASRLAGPMLATWDGLPAGEAEFRRATLSGIFLYDHEFRLLARPRGGRPG
ncbi:MAG: SURF1 family protein, partial [Rhodospirillaceae bacterium]|nr:SURF1 family protein [Rhodospirillaceae bacterium]